MSAEHIFLFIISYLLGSIPFGLIIAKLKKVDIRSQGSGNIGATNVTRVIGKKLGAVVLILDGLKGALAVLLTEYYLSSQPITVQILELGQPNDYNVILICAALAVIGHIFPIWLKFKGGKGVATTLAVLLTLNPMLGLAIICTWIATYLISKISSVSAITALILCPIWAYLLTSQQDFNLIYLCVFLAIIVISCHHENIKRLLAGAEK